MVVQNNLLVKQCSKLTVLAILTISIVSLTIQESLAVPLKPVLDQVGRRMVERSLGIDSAQATLPNRQTEEDTQETDPNLASKEETAPTPMAPAYPQPTYQQAYPPPIYPPAYPSPSYPAYPQQTYPQAYQSPINAMPVYVLPQAYPPTTYLSPPPNRTPVIINNF